ncbi:D-serine ammonia-lyase [Salinicoccus jeotgali]|uniref:Probable D-serine dehydratase n=1 Tax=Salinicoccus jeotgali TaxID=381634 RepID=A0ABP7ESX1_9STAP
MDSLYTLAEQWPLITEMSRKKEVFWENPVYGKTIEEPQGFELTLEDIKEADARLRRFAPFIQKAFDETVKDEGIIESPLLPADRFQAHLEREFHKMIRGSCFIKADNALTVSGSVKARGGIYEVLKYAEELAVNEGLIGLDGDYSRFSSLPFKKFFSDYTIICGSTGNLGLSIGIISVALGFKVTIHMSSDAKQWKKDLLREHGAEVVEHEDDYSKAVDVGRQVAISDRNSYFVDDENSKPLFTGYAVAALRLQNQLDEAGITVDEKHPLYVYLPCGVGSAPGGISFGLKQVYGQHVHPVFAEPVAAPSMLLGVMTGRHDALSVKDIGLDNNTVADGLAVGRPSQFIGKLLENQIHSFYTIADEQLYQLLATAYDTEGIKAEPSAAASFIGPIKMDVEEEEATHVLWCTGGSMVPEEVWHSDYQKGKI